jgi:hypothetical protein
MDREMEQESSWLKKLMERETGTGVFMAEKVDGAGDWNRSLHG